MTDEQIAGARRWAIEIQADAKDVKSLPIALKIALDAILDLTHDLQVARIAIAKYGHGFVEDRQ